MLGKLIRIAHDNPETRADLLPIIREAMEHKSPEAMKKYLQDHPKADRSKHHVGKPSPAGKLRNELSDDMKKKKKPEPDTKPDKSKGVEPKRTDKVPARAFDEDTKGIFQQVKRYFQKDSGTSSIIDAVVKGDVSFGQVQKAIKHIGKKRESLHKKMMKPGFKPDSSTKDRTVENSYDFYTSIMFQLSDMEKMTRYDVGTGEKTPAEKPAPEKKAPAPKKDEKKPDKKKEDKADKKPSKPESGKGSVSKATVQKFLPKTLNDSLKSVFPNSPLATLAESVDKGNVTTEQVAKALAHAEKKMESTRQMANHKNAPAWASAEFGNYQRMVGLLKDMKAATGGESKPDKKDSKPAPAKSKYNKKVQTVMTKHDLVDDDADEVKAFKKKKPSMGSTVSDAELMRRFLAKAKPETKERMKGMSPADFMKILGAITDEDEGGGKQASLRGQLIRIAHKYPKTRKHLLPLLKS